MSLDFGNWSKPCLPHWGWVCVAIEDLGEARELCEMDCGTEIRWVHTMHHAEWPEALRVGCICAAAMEVDPAAAGIREAKAKAQARVRERVGENAWSWLEAADRILLTRNLSLRERQFVSSIKARFARRSKQGFNPSPRQTEWFKSLYLKHVGK